MAGDGYDYGAGGDFRSKPNNVADEQHEDGPVNPKNQQYLKDLLSEKLIIDNEKLPIAAKLLDQEMTRAKAEGGRGHNLLKYVNVYHDKPTKVVCRALVPVKDHPKFNFVGKLLGPKGSTLKGLQEDTMCRMAILGRGSMRDREKEEEFRKSLDLKYAHLADDLHVEVTSMGPPAEAYARIAFALTELKKYILPDATDEVSQGQFREMEGFEEQSFGGFAGRPRTSGPGPVRRQFGRPGAPAKPPTLGRNAPRMLPGGGPHHGKSKVLSILDRARAAMADGQDEQYQEPYDPESIYDDYSSPAAAHSGYGGNRFGGSEYNEGYYGGSSNNFGENQRWKPYKTGNAAAGSNQSRYRPTPYAHGGK